MATVYENLLDKAIACEPTLLHTKVEPKELVQITGDPKAEVQITHLDTPDHIDQYPLKKGDSICLDFGDHQVGYVTFTFNWAGSPQDSPAYIRFKFGEVAKEIRENSAEYDGWISSSWIQEEFIHIDVLPATITLPRRYAFRYVEIMAMDTSIKWQLVVEQVSVDAVSCVSMDQVQPLSTWDELVDRMDRVALRTLQNCMQKFFEDGPKRDRRLWIGDMRLQALANYDTFKNIDLAKHCLYLFGAMPMENGKVGACLYTEPKYMVDDVYFFDYSMFFVPILYDYYMASKDDQALTDHWNVAKQQIRLAAEEFDENHLLKYDDEFKCFIDWKAGLHKQASAQAVYIYCARRALKIAELLNDQEEIAWLTAEIENKSQASMKYLWDESQGLFVSGDQKQVSYASQAWMVLAEVVDATVGEKALTKVLEMKPEMNMVTPYMNHHFVEALLMCGLKEQAMDYVKYYWGGMVQQGADTFWELYNPEDPMESPYGSSVVNSYCHAWSCTPAYLFRSYDLI